MSSSFLPDVNLGVAQSAGFNLDGFGALPQQSFGSALGAQGMLGGGLPAFDPISFGIKAALGIGSSILGYNAQKDAVRKQNERLQEQYRQRLRIQNMQDVMRFGQYNLKVASYKDQLVNLQKQFNYGNIQDQLQLNELFNQTKFAQQTENINRVQAVGRVSVAGQTGRTAARNMALASAIFGRQQAARQQRMLGSIYATELRGQARTQQLESSIKAAHSQVAYAPRPTPRPLAPTMLEGPSTTGLIANLAGNLLGATQTGFDQANYQKQLASTNFA